MTPHTVPDDDFLYVFMHLPKTGGTTVNAHLARTLGFDDRFAHLGPWGNSARAETGMPQPDEWPTKKRQRLRVISGHRVHATTHWLVEGREARYFTFLRDPPGLAVSQYNQDASRLEEPPGFWEWYRDRSPNPQYRWCLHRLGGASYDETITALGGFWFVGVTEQLDQDLPHIFDAIGVPTEWVNRRVAGGGHDLADVWPPIEDPVITRHQKLTNEISERVLHDDHEDIRLHSYARQRAEDLRLRYGWSEKSSADA